MTIPIMYMPLPLSSYRYIHVQSALACVRPMAQRRLDLTHTHWPRHRLSKQTWLPILREMYSESLGYRLYVK
jgi:hypothetical protein